MTPKEKAPAKAEARHNEVFSLVARHPAGLAFVGIDRNQKSVPVGVGEFVSLYIRAVIERAVHFEAVIVLGPEIPDVLQYDAFAIGTRLPFQLHGGHLTTPET